MNSQEKTHSIAGDMNRLCPGTTPHKVAEGQAGVFPEKTWVKSFPKGSAVSGNHKEKPGIKLTSVVTPKINSVIIALFKYE